MLLDTSGLLCLHNRAADRQTHAHATGFRGVEPQTVITPDKFR